MNHKNFSNLSEEYKREKKCSPKNIKNSMSKYWVFLLPSYQYTFLAFWMVVTVWTSLSVFCVFFSADFIALKDMEMENIKQ